MPASRTDPEEERLLVEAAREDPERFAELYDLHFDRVYAYAARRVPARQDAEDVAAEVFRRALGSIKRFQWRGAPFAAWLYRIAANEIAGRSNRRASSADPIDAGPSPEEDFAAVERRALLYRLVDDLPEDQRRVVRLRFSEEKPIREIARELDRSEGAVKQLQFRALKRLRELLEESL